MSAPHSVAPILWPPLRGPQGPRETSGCRSSDTSASPGTLLVSHPIST